MKSGVKTYHYQYSFDKGLNLVQRTVKSSQTRMIVASGSNRAVNTDLYNNLGLTPAQRAGLNRSLIDEHLFDKSGNQLQSASNSDLGWDYQGMLQTTITDIKDDQGSAIVQFKEYNLYAKTGRRNRKISEKTDALGNIVEIQEALYLGNLEYRTTWVGKNLSYNGENVFEERSALNPYEAYAALRIRQGRRQVAEKRFYTYKHGSLVSESIDFYSLENNIDSCELQLNRQGDLESYYANKPYGERAISYGKAELHPYKYSGQEKDQSGLYYYGYRSLLPQNFRWMSPDPAGVKGSQLNWYAMVGGNSITHWDAFGLLIIIRVIPDDQYQTQHGLVSGQDYYMLASEVHDRPFFVTSYNGNMYNNFSERDFLSLTNEHPEYFQGFDGVRASNSNDIYRQHLYELNFHFARQLNELQKQQANLRNEEYLYNLRYEQEVSEQNERTSRLTHTTQGIAPNSYAYLGLSGGFVTQSLLQTALDSGVYLGRVSTAFNNYLNSISVHGNQREDQKANDNENTESTQSTRHNLLIQSQVNNWQRQAHRLHRLRRRSQRLQSPTNATAMTNNRGGANTNQNRRGIRFYQNMSWRAVDRNLRSMGFTPLRAHDNGADTAYRNNQGHTVGISYHNNARLNQASRLNASVFGRGTGGAHRNI